MSKNCMCVQGHYYSHPLPKEKIEKILLKLNNNNCLGD